VEQSRRAVEGLREQARMLLQMAERMTASNNGAKRRRRGPGGPRGGG
jgi:hypothetical protein